MLKQRTIVLFSFLIFFSHFSFAQNTARGIVAEKIAVEQNDNVKKCEPQLYFSIGHTACVLAMAYSPDGRYVASGGQDNTIIIWDLYSRKELRKLIGHTFYVNYISYSPDGKFLASGSSDGTIRIWNVETGDELQCLKTESQILYVNYLKNSEFIISAAFQESSFLLWDLKSGKIIKSIIVDDEFYWDTNVINVYGDFVITVGYATLKIWDIESGKKIKELKIDNFEFASADFSPIEKEIAITDQRNVYVYDLETLKKIREFKFYGDFPKRGIKYSPDGKYFILEIDNEFGAYSKLIDAKSGEDIAMIPECCGSVFSPDSHFFCIAYAISKGVNNKGLKIYNIDTLQSEDLGLYCEFVSNITFNVNEEIFTSGSADGTITLWNLKTGEKVKELKGHEKSIKGFAYSFDGKRLASCSTDNTIRIWDIESGKELKKIKATDRYFGYADYLTFSKDGKFLLIGDNYGLIKILNSSTGDEIKKIDTEFTSIDIITLSLDGKYIIFGNNRYSEKIGMVDFETGEKIYDRCYTKEKFIFSAEGNTVVFYDNTEMTKKVVKTEKRIDSVNYANTSIDGKYSITVSDRFTIKVWNVETGSLIYTIVNGKNGDYLTYTPEGFFTGTEWAMKNLVHIVDGMDVIGIDQVYDKLYRPDLVAAKMRGEDISEYAKEVNLASIVRSGNAPAVAIENLPELSDSRDVTFDICVQNTGGGIGNVSIVLNGKTIRLSEGVASSKGEQKIFRHTVTLKNGQNKIEAFAMNSAGMIESRRASADVSWQGKTSKPNLYVLTVAVNKYRDKDLWLNYCVSDAASIEESFKKQKNGLYENICVYSLKDAEVTKEGLEQKFKELSSIVTADDVFVFFVSGHGTAYDDGDYYFIPVNFRYTNKTDIPLKAISKSDLTKNLSLIKAGKTLMMLDTCNSGAFFADSNKRGMGDKGIFERLSRATGHAVLAAASDSQSAMEGYNGHGVFTYVLLDGLAGNADSDGDGFVTLTELSSYVENQVPELSYEKWGYEQVPQKELRRQDFPIAEKLSE